MKMVTCNPIKLFRHQTIESYLNDSSWGLHWSDTGREPRSVPASGM